MFETGLKESVEGVKNIDNLKLKAKEFYKDLPDNKEDNLDKPLSEEINKITPEDREKMEKETGWSDEILDCIDTNQQYEIYKNADLIEAEINGRKCLIKKDFDLDYFDENEGKTNAKLIADGRTPYDSKTGERIELHHMGQSYDAPFVELTEHSEHGGKNHSALHPKHSDSWRNDSTKENHYNNVERPNHWKERIKQLEGEN